MSAVMSGMGTTSASGEAIDCSEAVSVARRRRKRSHEVYVNVQETCCRGAGMIGKHVPRCGSPFARLATQNALCPASLLLWCPGVTDRGWTGTLGAVVELEHKAEISQ
jgi:hypothetical protein